MKKMLICGLLFIAAASFKNADAQVRVNLNVNIGSQPAWGPAGYDYVEYYYLPDIQAYYYVPRHQFIYLSGGRWIFSSYLPPAYRSYNLYSGYKVVVNQPRAYQYYNTHRVKYAGYRGNRGQVVIRNSDNPRYYVVKGHPKYKSQGRGNGRGKGNGRGRH
ncbi:MAG TPA: hypothetical protein VF476_00295 [Chitinophagaceae bacterium]